MSKITIYPTEPCNIAVAYSENPLDVYGKAYTDIEEVVMCFKKVSSDAENKYLVKYYKDGAGVGVASGDVLIDEANNTFTMVKNETDNVEIHSSGYGVYIGVKVAGLSKYLWLRVKKDNSVIVEPDGISV